MSERERFESIISGPPYEKSIQRWPDDATKHAWPGSYRHLDVNLAWHVLEDYVARSGQAASGSSQGARSDGLSIDVVEQRLLTWKTRTMNQDGDQLSLDDFMDQESLDDLIDFVCAPPTRSAKQGATPPAPAAPPGHWDEYAMHEARRLWNLPAMPKSQLVASLHCALIDAMRFAASPQPAATSE